MDFDYDFPDYEADDSAPELDEELEKLIDEMLLSDALGG